MNTKATRPRGIVRLREDYIQALLEGNASEAARLIDAALAEGRNPLRLYVDVLTPAQWEIGQQWHDGKVNIAQEHLATQITWSQMDHLRRAVPNRPKLDLRAVVTAVQGELHVLGPRMVADFLYIDGWEVDFLGANVPAPDLVDFVRQRPAQLVALAMTVVDHLPHLREAVQGLKTLKPTPRILVGGSGVMARHDEVSALGVDIIGSDALDALQHVRRLFGLGGAAPCLGDLLQALGQRVRSLRKARGWNQEQLAQAAGLDRTYISAVEHGKQNLTLGVVLKIGEALGTDLVQLLIGGPPENAGRNGGSED